MSARIGGLALGFFLSACASAPAYQDGWVRAEIGTFAALSVADATITDCIIDQGGRELNPILGEDPGLPALLGLKVGGALALAGITELACIRVPANRCVARARTIWGAATAVSVVPVAHKARQL